MIAALSLVLSMTTMVLSGIDPTDTRLMEQPAIGQDHIAFIYANDLWVANLDGSQPRRLTVSEGVESRPHFSPDGKHIAFSAQYDGNMDVFLLPVEGGIPQRLTWHPSADRAAGFTPDGAKVLFLSNRTVHTGRFMQLFTRSSIFLNFRQLFCRQVWPRSQSSIDFLHIRRTVERKCWLGDKDS